MQVFDYNLCELEVGLLKKIKLKTEYPAHHHFSVKACRGYGSNAFHFLKWSTLGGWFRGYILLPWSRILQTEKRSNESVKYNRSWETNISLPSKETSRNVWKTKVRYCAQNTQKIGLSFYCFNVRFNIILPATRTSSNYSLSFRISNQNSVCSSVLPCKYQMLWPQPSWYKHPKNSSGNYQL
jgi:hypothetical protein